MKNLQHKEDEYIIIPNPIYDVVFKYLMEDNQSAKIVLSTLLNEKIKKLDFKPISHTERVKDPKTIKLFHLDFTAVIEKPDGEEELIMIEIQKANNPGDIFRFKRYISANFQYKKEGEIINPRTQEVEKIEKPLRLIPIFILNFRIENEVNDLIIRTSREKIGVFKGKSLKKGNDFIDNLSFDIWVVQLPNLSEIDEKDYKNDEYKEKLYLLLKLFDQNAKSRNNRHRLLIVKKLFPEFLDRVINRLKAADAENPNLEEQMNIEDEYLSELIRKNNEISFFAEKFEQEKKIREKQDKVIEENKKVIEENKKVIEKNKKVIQEEREKAEAERKKARAEHQKLIETAKLLFSLGVDIETISVKTGLSTDELQLIK